MSTPTYDPLKDMTTFEFERCMASTGTRIYKLVSIAYIWVRFVMDLFRTNPQQIEPI